MDETSVRFEEHFVVEQLLLLSCFVKMRTLLVKELLFLHISPEILDELGLYFFIFDVQSIADVVKFPSFLNLKVFG